MRDKAVTGPICFAERSRTHAETRDAVRQRPEVRYKFLSLRADQSSAISAEEEHTGRSRAMMEIDEIRVSRRARVAKTEVQKDLR